VAALEAGCVAVLLCNSPADEQATALEALVYAMDQGRLSRKRVDDALRRQQEAKARLATVPRAPALDVVGCDAHRAVAEEMSGWL
jgi:beta-glucosidase-like glycosyl hydrolase